MKKLLAAIAVVLVVVGAYFGFATYEQHKFVESIQPHVKNTSLRLMNASRYETEDHAKITYKELFDKLESDISEIDKRILEVQMIATPANKEVTDPVIGYMAGSQEFLRGLLAKYRTHMAYRNASDGIDRAIKGLGSSTNDEFEYAKKEFVTAIAESDKAVSDFIVSVDKLKDTLALAAAVLPSDSFIDPSILDAIAKKNAPKAEDPSPTVKK